jgi:AcrR family transcriptional regulator
VGHREELLAAARRLVREKGFARTTARDLVAASGTNLASIGYHFGSKEQLLNKAIAAEFAEWARHVGEVALGVDGATPLDRLAVALATIRDSYPRLRPLLVAFLEATAQAERSPELRAQLARHVTEARRVIADMVRASMPDVDLPADQAAAVASFIMALCDGLAWQWLIDPDTVPDGQALVSALGSALAAGLTAGPGDSRLGASLLGALPERAAASPGTTGAARST